MRSLLLSTVAFAALGGVALAGDLPSTKEAPVFAAPAPTGWTGFYVGGFGAYGWGGNQSWSVGAVSLWSTPGDYMGSGNSNGGFGGIQIGYNYQFAPAWVATLGADVGFGSIGGSVKNPISYPFTNAGMNGCATIYSDQIAKCQANATVMADFLVRLGYLVTPNTLLYVKGGLAVTNIEYQVTNIVDVTGGNCGPVGTVRANYNNVNRTAAGGIFGAGAEYKFTDHFSGFVEYDYTTGGGTHSVFMANNSGDSCVSSFTANVNAGGGVSTIRAGLNYMFAEPAPVVAKY